MNNIVYQVAQKVWSAPLGSVEEAERISVEGGDTLEDIQSSYLQVSKDILEVLEDVGLEVTEETCYLAAEEAGYVV